MYKLLNDKSLWFFLVLFIASPATAQTIPSLYGYWQGQIQYQAYINGKLDPSAHSVVNFSINIDPQGKVTGSSPENGCRLLGIATPGLVPTVLNLDITFSNCTYTAYNSRFSGTFAYYTTDQHSTISLTSAQIGIGKISANFDIRGILRRP